MTQSCPAGPPLPRPRGFTVVEMMVGLTVGLFVALAASSVFVSTRTLQTVSSAQSRLGENVRLAMELLRKDFRAAGFQGCNSPPWTSSLNPGNGLFLDAPGAIVGGSHGTGGAFTPALNATLAGLPQPPLNNSDVIVVRVPVEPLALGLISSAGTPQVGVNTPGNTLVQSDIVLVANCMAAAVYQVTEANPQATGQLTHLVSPSFNPGNANAGLPVLLDASATVYKLQTHHYYVAASAQSPGTNSLWRYVFPTTDGSPNPQEVVQGIERMVVSYGVDNGTLPNTPTANMYVTADSVVSWGSVVAARIQLLAATVKDGVTLSAQPASFAGGTVTPTDRRLRYQVTEVVTLRNQAP